MFELFRKIGRSVRYRLGMRVAAPDLETGEDETVTTFYQSRITDCSFLADSKHYEHPRVQWILQRVKGGRLLEIGCGNGGMTCQLASLVEQLVAVDISTPSLTAVERMQLENVETAGTLIEQFQPSNRFDWIVMAEVLEHLRKPEAVLAKCLQWLTPRGRLLLTTPNGHWETDEHLHEFNFESLMGMLSRCGAETVKVGYLRDREKRRRWLVAELAVPMKEPAPDDFHDRLSVARNRRKRVLT